MTTVSLAALGWSAFFQSQLDPSEAALTPARLSELHRSRLVALGEQGEMTLHPPPGAFSADLAVGDWLLIRDGALVRRLERRSALIRQAAGSHVAAQAIAANVDTIFIVTSCTAEFNERRIERYLALAAQAGCLPVIVLTKADLSDDPDRFRAAAMRLRPGQIVETVDARDSASLAPLLAWCGEGQTVALLGSSGVGKTTLTNALTGRSDLTAAIREDDAQGRHTTTFRALRPMPSGGHVIDTPGMRALRLTDVAEGIDATFGEIADLAGQCRFRDCSHGTEPGCAIRAAIDRGEVEEGRLESWQKLRAEDQRHSETLAEHHARARGFGKLTRRAQRDKARLRGAESDD